ncbi:MULTISPECIES: hypothetical protein [Rhizobium]|jgi:hypothetical protein|uniref:Fimbrial protein n=1 Tax=Rhizobium wenxiniae TaxID=1737357 RepID=A0A7W9Y3F5_9HYPH|nr:hypothetical protein [Rhizobium wenxiniae]MBB6161296.1 hypothetical protein [Rhizobium wenxiniae]GGF87753.1 hypothetical protein GCM10010924_14460 [Rhizobium wenxiniae]
MPQPDLEDKEQPLDPAMERIRQKMVRLQLISGGILVVCFMAVIAAIVYKISQRPEAPAIAATSGGFSVPADQPLAVTAALPPGFDIQQVSLSGSQVLFYGALNGTPKVFIFDLSVGRVIADVTVGQGR